MSADQNLSMDTSEMNVIFVHSAIDDYPLTVEEFRVYSHIARRAGAGEAWPKVETVAKHCRIHPDTARRCLQNLIEYGLLSATERKGKTTLYRITRPSLWKRPETALAIQKAQAEASRVKRTAKAARKAAEKAAKNEDPSLHTPGVETPPFKHNPSGLKGGYPSGLKGGHPSGLKGAEVNPLRGSLEVNPGGEYNLTGDAHARGTEPAQPATTPGAEPSPLPVTTTDTSLSKDVKAVRDQGASVAVLSPDGEAASTATSSGTAEPHQVLPSPPVDETTNATSTEDVPGAAAGGPGDWLDDFVPHDPDETRQVLMRALGGAKKLDALLDEVPPGLRSGSRRLWLVNITPERAQQLIDQGRATPGQHPWTAITQLLDQEIGATIARGGNHQQPSATANAGSHAPAQHIEPSDFSGDQGKYEPGAVWIEKATGKVFRMVGLETTTNKTAGGGARYRFDDNTVVPALTLMTKYEFQPEASA